MAILKRDDILKADDLPTERVAIKEWGGEVIMRALTGVERDQYEMAMFEARREGDRASLNIRAHLVAMCAVDETGQRLFSDADVARLGRKSGKALDRAFEAAQRLSGIGAAALERAVGNSNGATGDAPSSGSPSPSDDSPTSSAQH